MSKTIVIAPGAKADIADIWDYTATEYGADAADAYVTEMDAVMRRMLDFPDMGIDCSAIRKGYRRMRAGSHLIYYIPHKWGIDVMRVLHERRDATRQSRYPNGGARRPERPVPVFPGMARSGA